MQSCSFRDHAILCTKNISAFACRLTAIVVAVVLALVPIIYTALEPGELFRHASARLAGLPATGTALMIVAIENPASPLPTHSGFWL
jgi:hypothetical protein